MNSSAYNMKSIFKKISLILIFSCISLVSFSQDFHFSQYWGAPLQLNPALTGLFSKNIRVNANYRNQWIQFNSFTTYSASVDANIFRDKLKGNFIGLGLAFYQELAAESAFKNTGVNFSFAYNKLLESKHLKHHLSFGFNATYNIREVNLRDVVYGNLYEKNDNYDLINLDSYANKTFMDAGLGVNYLLNIKDKQMISVGFSANNLLEQRKDYGSYEDANLYRKFSLNLSGEFLLKQKIALIPLLLFQSQGPHTELSFGTYGKYILNERKNTSLYLGIQYRMAAYENTAWGSDAVILGLRAEIKDFDFGLSYDFTVSTLSQSAVLLGGPELYLSYAIALKKNNKRMKCPNF
jgi:type IX secretion system PorP/SprF family membrane protein